MSADVPREPRFVGERWRMEFAYAGSFFRSRFPSYDYETPFRVQPVVLGAVSPFEAKLTDYSLAVAKQRVWLTSVVGPAEVFSLVVRTEHLDVVCMGQS